MARKLRGKVDGKKRRIVITHWVREAYSKLMGNDYPELRWRRFDKTGCLITADGAEDSKVEPDSLTRYTIPPSLQVVSSDQAMQCPIPESKAEEPSEDSESENQEILCMEYEENEQEVVECSDEELDRIYKHPLKNRRVKILYEKWTAGCIL